MVQVNTLNGTQLDVAASNVAQLKAQLVSLCGYAVDQQVIISQGYVLANDALISNNQSVYVAVDLDGGAKKKKKVYSKPKKVSHKNKKTKLRILNLYKIEGDGKVVRLRKECSACGGAFFMANHKDRYTCGNCHRTQKRED